MKEIQDWIVDDFVYVNGTGVSSYLLEFVAPRISGTHEYEVNVYYFENNNWFYLGPSSVYNFTIEVTGTLRSLVYYKAEIHEVVTPESIELDTEYNLDVSIGYDFEEETDISVQVIDPGSGNILVESLDTIEGEGLKDYTIIVDAPSEYGVIDLEVLLIYFNGTGWGNPDENAGQVVTIEISEPPVSNNLYVYVGLGVVVLGLGYYFISQRNNN